MLLLTFPLPLDLHVLSLSLAFILSQDQTLRCLYHFYLFRFCDWTTPLDSWPVDAYCDRELTWAFCSCTTSSIAIISMSVVLRPFLRAENFAKVRQVFELAKYFADFFTFLILGLSSDWPLSALVLKSECKGRYFYVIKHIFAGFSFPF